jgi:hypothetical protein
MSSVSFQSSNKELAVRLSNRQMARIDEVDDEIY